MNCVACYVQECQRLASACCKALNVLHDAGIVQSDIREENTVWLGDEDAMLIDLEHCRFERDDVPDNMQLSAWDDATFEVGPSGGRRYTFASDVYLVGNMLSKMAPASSTALAIDFISKLKAKQLTVGEALAHSWLSGLG